MAILEAALCQAHRNNISRYNRLLETYLTDIERNFVELRLWEERAALRHLDAQQPDDDNHPILDRTREV